MNRNIILVIGILVLFLAGCTLGNIDQNEDLQVKPVIQTTIYPLYYFTSRIAGDGFTVQNFIPLGVEPHSWEPKPSDLIKIEESQVFIYNGAGFEHWIVDLVDAVDNEDLTIINATEGLRLIKNVHSATQDNPHCWLDPVRAQAMAYNIKTALIAEYPNEAEELEENYEGLFVDLENLHQKHLEVFAQISKQEIIVTHDAFGYLAERYGLKQIPVISSDAHSEPTPGKLAELVRLAREYDVRYVFAEEMVSSKVIETLANEAGLKIKTLNPLGNLTLQDMENQENYLSIMDRNLEILGQALQ